MKLRYHPLAWALGLFCATAVSAATPPPLSGQPSVSEAKFVSAIRADLLHRFPTTRDAERAGYIRYTEEDETGAISYANRHWTSADPRHPSQLWYDVHGRLLGADFSVPGNAPRPHLWGIDPQRWVHFGAHIHYVLRAPEKGSRYGGMGIRRFVAAGGDALDPRPEFLVRAKVVTNAENVRTVFLFPEIWDLIVWLVPNPSGAFAEKNPNVHPSRATRGM